LSLKEFALLPAKTVGTAPRFDFHQPLDTSRASQRREVAPDKVILDEVGFDRFNPRFGEIVADDDIYLCPSKALGGAHTLVTRDYGAIGQDLDRMAQAAVVSYFGPTQRDLDRAYPQRSPAAGDVL
jgi:hypothetical protein